MNNKEPRYVYILTFPSFREDWVKIGKSSRLEDVRSKELDKELDNNAMLAQDSCPFFVHRELLVPSK